MVKNILLTFSFLLSISLVHCQINLTVDDFIASGDTARVSNAMDNTIDFQTTGPNSVWDFSYLTANSQKLIQPQDVSTGGFLVDLQFGAGAGKWQADYFRSLELPLDQAGQFLPINIQDSYRFIQSREDSLSYVGIGLKIEDNIIGFRSDTIEKAYDFPVEYGDAYSSTGHTVADFNPFFDGIFIQNRQRESVVDGHGTLMTPFGMFNVLRMHHQIDELDSLFINLQGFEQWIPLDLPRTHIYEWWAKDQMLPVMQITTQEINGDETVSSIEYRDVYLGLDASLSEYELDFNVFPNPASEVMNINAKSTLNKVLIFDNKGKLVYDESEVNNLNTVVNTSSFKSGLYLVQVHANGQVLRKKIIVQ